MDRAGDSAFRAEGAREHWVEMTYGGALSFLRRRYTRDLAGVDVAVMGFPYDASVTYRPGCRLGPRAIRAASVQLAELKAFPSGFDLMEALAVVDRGDCLLDPHHPETVAPAIEAAAAEVIAAGAKLLALGGDHFIAWPLLRAHAAKHGPLALVQVDAHGDLWPDDPGRIDHGTMMGRAIREGLVDPARSTQVGIRTFHDTTEGLEVLTAPWMHRNGIAAALEVVARPGRRRAGLPHLRHRRRSTRPSRRAPARRCRAGSPAGRRSSSSAGSAPLDLVGMDIVEVSPPFDHAEITALAAAHIAHDWLCVLAEKAGATPHPVGRV